MIAAAVFALFIIVGAVNADNPPEPRPEPFPNCVGCYTGGTGDGGGAGSE